MIGSVLSGTPVELRRTVPNEATTLAEAALYASCWLTIRPTIAFSSRPILGSFPTSLTSPKTAASRSTNSKPGAPTWS